MRLLNFEHGKTENFDLSLKKNLREEHVASKQARYLLQRSASLILTKGSDINTKGASLN